MLCANKLTTFANILDPYQAQKNLDLICIQTVCHWWYLFSHEYKDDDNEIEKWFEQSFQLHVLDKKWSLDREVEVGFKILFPPTRQVNRATYNNLSFIIMWLTEGVPR